MDCILLTASIAYKDGRINVLIFCPVIYMLYVTHTHEYMCVCVCMLEFTQFC